MARGGVTDFHVEKAAESLIKRGINPTIEKVRRELGDTGSATTISKHLSDWKRRQAGTHLTKLTPQEMFDGDISDSIKRIYAVLELRASEEFQGEIDQCNDMIARKDTELAKGSEELVRANEVHREALESIAELKQSLTDKDSELATTSARLRGVEIELAAKNEQNKNLQIQVKDIKELTEKITGELEQSILKEVMSVKALSEAKDKELELTKDNIRLNQQAYDLRGSLESLKQELEAIKAKPADRPFARNKRR